MGQTFNIEMELAHGTDRLGILPAIDRRPLREGDAVLGRQNILHSAVFGGYISGFCRVIIQSCLQIMVHFWVVSSEFSPVPMCQLGTNSIPYDWELGSQVP